MTVNPAALASEVTRSSVAVIGGGPVGLSLAFLLGRQGVNTALFETRKAASDVLKGQYLGPSTVELFRQWGIMDELVPAGWRFGRFNGAGFYETLKSKMLFAFRRFEGDETQYQQAWSSIVPALPQGVPASAYEASLTRIAGEQNSVILNHQSTILDIESTGTGSRLLIKNLADGSYRFHEADYVVFAAGKQNPLARRLGADTLAGPNYGSRILAVFDGPLRQLLGETPYYFYRIMHPQFGGIFQSEIPHSGHWSYLYASNSPEDLDRSRVISRVRAAIGDPDFPIDLKAVVRFEYNSGIARRWRVGNVLFAGDAAHHHPPSGGFGVNMGIGDANNLAWKLALVVKGEADSALLDTYETERKPLVDA